MSKRQPPSGELISVSEIDKVILPNTPLARWLIDLLRLAQAANAPVPNES